MRNPALDLLPDSPFVTLRALLDDVAPPAGVEPVSMAVGEPVNGYPALVGEILAAHVDLWGRYAPMGGTEALNAAMIGWLMRRFGLPEGAIRPGQSIAPLAGTREGLFLLPQVVTAARSGDTPAVLIPSPFYHTYAGAALAAGAEPVFLPTDADTHHLPDLDAVSPDLWARASLIYLCSPTNPGGTVADLDYLTRLVNLARAHDVVVVADECYADLYFGDPPPSALQAALALDGTLTAVVVVHSLSKRSSVPGLRAGFCAGDPAVIRPFLRLREYGAVFMPLPAQAVAARLWADDAHVAVNRAYYRANMEVAEAVLGDHPGFARPEAGFFLWLRVGDGEAVARRLWVEAGIRAVPGAYLGRPDARGRNTGAPYLRFALVHDRATTEAALRRVRAVL
ncbi:aminotransferase class I/II-fold pyridoxal phosphate-dependent enzyme [Roseospira visakhapatnamensis]|uniref:Aminotransferase n=1 Tax=Roseospira visakhapatnamensis TaxID=390880 RepID=A0A7W6RDG6_9PROT|nr:aminotransferase class I/II-fold pyridoxal phosphate-dependent enzyme [Roseospira visakhapatnamensis]MBB4265994.1 aspartate/methionine/tyrosine aminotransferase [Roseospira visakhapatnamensis]